MSAYHDHFYASTDGLRLYARDYPHSAPRGTVLCMHGLTRNSADFSVIAAALNEEFRVVSVDQRGRGRSDYDSDAANYTAEVYVRDMFTLFDDLGIERTIAIGTSMGGVISMAMAATAPQRLQGVVLNDIGPAIDPAGLDRIRSYVGLQAPVTTWAEAAAQVRASNAVAFPDYGDAEWMTFARNLYRENDGGVPVLAHDPAIAESLKETNVPVDLWPLFDAMAGIPLLVVRGATSDILSPETVAEMQRRRPDLQAVEVPHRGHAPMLDEPEATAAIRHFLDEVVVD